MANKRVPAVPVAEVAFTLYRPPGTRFVRLRSLPDNTTLEFSSGKHDLLSAAVDTVEAIGLVAAEYR